MNCPNCQGGKIYAAFHPVSIPCSVCNGTGILPADIEYDPERGKNMKDRRIWLGITLRLFCIANGTDAVTRSEEERGFFRKSNSAHAKGREDNG